MTETPSLLSEQALRNAPAGDYMNAAQLAFFRNHLEALRAWLCANAQATSEKLRDQETPPDANDRATLEEERTLELRARDREHKLLGKIAAALQRIENGSYGYCEESGEPIGIPRLLARPTATLTVEAQERRERLDRIRAG